MRWLFSPSRIGLIFNRKKLERNLKDWSNQKCPLLIITGMAGSGKTYLAQKIALTHNVKYISLDSLKYYSSASSSNKKLVDEFVLGYPNVQKYINVKFNYFNDPVINDKIYTCYSFLFLNYLSIKATKENELYVVEGIHFFMRFPISVLYSNPLIIIRTSLINSIYQKFQRDYLSGTNEYRKSSGIDIFDDLIRYEIEQYIQLCKYLRILPKSRI